MENKPPAFDADLVWGVSVGLTAASIAAILAMLTLTAVDKPLQVSLLCFCFSTPILIFSGIHSRRSAKASYSMPLCALYLGSVALTGIGFVAIPFHFGYVFGIVFSLSAICSFALGLALID
jgi:hypothetical protein